MKTYYGISVEEIKRIISDDSIVGLAFIHYDADEDGKPYLAICPNDHTSKVRLDEMIKLNPAQELKDED